MFFILNKPKNISSFNSIKQFAKENKIKKIGHSGTLDPFATGLLLVATDEDTKLLPYINNKNKTYIAQIKLGMATDTFDSEGKITKTSNKTISHEQLDFVKLWLLSQKEQIPPIFSAKKINGIRSYKLARENKEQTISLSKQKIEIFDVEILNFSFKEQVLDISLTVSNGTYIRSLANDLGLALGTYGYLQNLERTKIGNIHKNELGTNKFVKISSQQILGSNFLELSKEQLLGLKDGKQIQNVLLENGVYFLLNSIENEIFGIVEISNKLLKVKKLFGNRLQKLL